MSARRVNVDLDRLCGFVNERQDPGDDITRKLVGDLAEHHDLAPFEQARFELVDDPFSRAPVAVVRRIGIFRRFIGIAAGGWVMAQSRILYGFSIVSVAPAILTHNSTKTRGRPSMPETRHFSWG